MAKSILTKQMINFLVDTYDDETTNHTFAEIREMLIDKFNVTVSIEAIRKSYHKNKTEANTKPKYVEKPVEKKPLISSSNISGLTKNTGGNKNSFDTSMAEDLSSDNIDDLLKSSDE